MFIHFHFHSFLHLSTRRHPSAAIDEGIDTGDEGDLLLDDADDDLVYDVDSHPPQSRPPSSKASDKPTASDQPHPGVDATGGVVGGLDGGVAADGGVGGAGAAAAAGAASRPPSAGGSVGADSTGKKSAGGKSSAGSKRRSAGLQQPKTPGAIQVSLFIGIYLS